MKGNEVDNIPFATPLPPFNTVFTKIKKRQTGKLNYRRHCRFIALIITPHIPLVKQNFQQSII